VTGIQFPGPPAKPIVPDPTLKLPSWAIGWIEKYNIVTGDQNPSGPMAFTAELEYARAWSDYYGRPIHLGEFGSFTTADARSRANFYGAVRRVCDREKIGWAIWDWNAGFRYWNEKENQPMPGLREALFGKE
jgi:endoglucanase